MAIIGLFNFFKKGNQQEEEVSKEMYWSLSTNEEMITDPTWAEIEAAVANATPEGSLFASLGYINSGLEIEIIQTSGENGIYRFEALPPEDSLEYGDIYVNDGLTLEEVLKLFELYYENRSVSGYRGWEVEKT